MITSKQGVCDQRLNAWPQQRGARDRTIRIFFYDLPALLLRIGAARAQLVGDGGVTLIVGGVTGLERDLHLATSQKNRDRLRRRSSAI